jgi:hypothetical protein
MIKIMVILVTNVTIGGMINMSQSSETAWNIFAAELLTILARHDANLSSLERKGDPDDRINPAVVRRLKKSLELQGTFPVLSATDLKKVQRTFNLSQDEYRHLIAAILVTGIQQKLTPRINGKLARNAAVAILPIIEDALEQAEINEGPLAQIRVKSIEQSGEDSMFGEECDYDRALEAIDRGILAIHVLDRINTQHWVVPIPSIDHNINAQEAYLAFDYALTIFQSISEEKRKNYDDWQYWYDIAVEGRSNAAWYQGREDYSLN